jgi:hypothetical protein
VDAPPIDLKPIKSGPIWPKLIGPKLILPCAVSVRREAGRPHFVHLGAMQPEMLWPKQNGGAGMLRRLSCELRPNSAAVFSGVRRRLHVHHHRRLRVRRHRLGVHHRRLKPRAVLPRAKREPRNV